MNFNEAQFEQALKLSNKEDVSACLNDLLQEKSWVHFARALAMASAPQAADVMARAIVEISKEESTALALVKVRDRETPLSLSLSARPVSVAIVQALLKLSYAEHVLELVHPHGNLLDLAVATGLVEVVIGVCDLLKTVDGLLDDLAASSWLSKTENSAVICGVFDRLSDGFVRAATRANLLKIARAIFFDGALGVNGSCRIDRLFKNKSFSKEHIRSEFGEVLGLQIGGADLELFLGDHPAGLLESFFSAENVRPKDFFNFFDFFLERKKTGARADAEASGLNYGAFLHFLSQLSVELFSALMKKQGVLIRLDLRWNQGPTLAAQILLDGNLEKFEALCAAADPEALRLAMNQPYVSTDRRKTGLYPQDYVGSSGSCAGVAIFDLVRSHKPIISKVQANLFNWNQLDGEGLSLVTVAARANNASAFRWCMDYFLEDIERSGDDDFLYQAVKCSSYAVLEVLKEYWPKLSDSLKACLLEYAEGLDTPASFAIDHHDLGTLYWLLQVSSGLVGHDESRYAEYLQIRKPGGLPELIAANNAGALAYFLGCKIYDEYVSRALTCEASLISNPSLGAKTPASWVQHFSRNFSLEQLRQEDILSKQFPMSGKIACVPERPVAFLVDYLWRRGQFQIESFEKIVRARSFLNVGVGIKLAQQPGQALAVQQYFESFPEHSDFGVLSQHLADNSFVVDPDILRVLLAKGLKCNASFCFKVVAKDLLRHVEILRDHDQELTRPYRGCLPLFEAISLKSVDVVKFLAALTTYRANDLKLIDLKIKHNLFEEALATGAVQIVQPVWECLARYKILDHFVSSRYWLDQVTDPEVICFMIAQLDERLIQLLLPADEPKIFEAIFLTGEVACFERFVSIQHLENARVLQQCGDILNRHVPIPDYTKVLSRIDEFFICSAIARRDDVIFNKYVAQLASGFDWGYFFFVSLFVLKAEHAIPIQQYFFDEFLASETPSDFMAQLSTVARQQIWNGLFWYGTREQVGALKKRWSLKDEEVLRRAQNFFNDQFLLGVSSHALCGLDEIFIYGYAARGLFVEFEKAFGEVNFKAQAYKSFDLGALFFSVVRGCCESSIFLKLLNIEEYLFNEERLGVLSVQSDKKSSATIGSSPSSSTVMRKISERGGVFYNRDSVDRLDFIFQEISGGGPQGAFQQIRNNLEEVLSFFTSEPAVHKIMMEGLEAKEAVIEFLVQTEKSRLPPFVVLKALAKLKKVSLVLWRKDAADNLILAQQYCPLPDSQVLHILESDYSLERLNFEGEPALSELLEYDLIPPANSSDVECISPHRLVEVLPSRYALNRQGESLLDFLVKKTQHLDCAGNARDCLKLLLTARTDSLYYNFNLKNLLVLLEEQKSVGHSLISSDLSLTAVALAYDHLSKGLADCLAASRVEFQELDKLRSSFYVLYLSALLRSGGLISTEFYKIFDTAKSQADQVLVLNKAEVDKIKELRDVLKKLCKPGFFLNNKSKEIGKSWVTAADAKKFFEEVLSARLIEPLKILEFLSRQEFLLTSEDRDRLQLIQKSSAKGFSKSDSALLEELFRKALPEVHKECGRGFLNNIAMVQSVGVKERPEEIQRQVAYLSNVAKIDRRVLVPALIDELRVFMRGLEQSEEVVEICEGFIKALVARQYYDPSNERCFLAWRAKSRAELEVCLTRIIDQGSQALLSWLRSLSPDYCKEALNVCLELVASDIQRLKGRLQEMRQSKRDESVLLQQRKIERLSLLKNNLKLYKDRKSDSGIFSFYGEGLAAKQSWLMGLKVLLDSDDVDASWRAIRGIIEQHSPSSGDWGVRTEALVSLFRDCSVSVESLELFYKGSPEILDLHLTQLGYPPAMRGRIQKWCTSQSDDWDRQVLNQSITTLNFTEISGSPSRRGVGSGYSPGFLRPGSRTPSRGGSVFDDEDELDLFGDDALLGCGGSTPSSSGQAGDEVENGSQYGSIFFPYPAASSAVSPEAYPLTARRLSQEFLLAGRNSLSFLARRQAGLPKLADVERELGEQRVGGDPRNA